MDEVLDDLTLLKVSGQKGSNKHDRKKLANALLITLTKHGKAKFRCVGAASLNNAILATAIASEYVKTDGFRLSLIPVFSNATFEDGMEKTCIILEVSKLAEVK